MSWTKISKQIADKIKAAHEQSDYTTILSITIEHKLTSFEYCCPSDPSFISYIDKMIELDMI